MVPTVSVCLKCGVLKIGQRSIKISKSRMDMDNKPIKNLGAPTVSTDAARLSDASAPTNKGQQWISHGDNVITFGTEHSGTTYRWVASIALAGMGGITTRGPAHTQPARVKVSNGSTTRGKVRIDGGYGFTSCGYISAVTGATERFDDTANTHTARTAATARQRLTGYSLNGYGFTSCGITDVNVGTTERFDDTANTHTARADATARQRLTGYSLNGYGFTSCGYIAANPGVGTTERFDDTANTHTARTAATARYYLVGYSLNGYGFTSCGTTGSTVGTTERFDDTANTHTARADATARYDPAGYATNEYFVNYITYNA